MEETANKKGFSKKVVAIIIVIALLVIGGSVTAYVLLTQSAKAQYFKAEANTIEFISKKVEERYQPEFDWATQAKENPTETTLELSAEYNGSPTVGTGMKAKQIINNSTIQLTTQLDQDEKQLATDVQVKFGGIEVKDISVYLDANKLMLQLPFLKESLQIKDTELGDLLQEADPAAFTGTDIDFNTFFASMDGLLSEKDKEYLQEKYIKMIYKELPGDAFKTTEETVKVQDKSVKTKKITLSLSEKQIKNLVTTVLEKMKKDDRLKEMIKEQLKLQQFGSLSSKTMADPMESEIDTIMKDFEKSIDQAIDGIKDFQIPDGLTSTIWVKDDLIVKRDLKSSMAPKGEQVVTFRIKASQLLNDNEQKLEYKLILEHNDIINLAANLSNKDNELDDSVTITIADEYEITYEGSSTLEDGTREFERVFSLNSPDPANSGSLKWSGEATYKNDKMSSEHTFSLEAPRMTQNMGSLHISKEAKTIKKVDKPDTSNVKDIGNMSINEIAQYVQTEVVPQFQQWLIGVMGAGGNANSF